jgi:uncharacterized protein with PIN domain
VKHVTFRFYAELNDLLPSAKRQVSFLHPYEGRVSVKHLIESLGVPHGEVDLILVNGQPVDFSYLVEENDRISVYPVFETIDISPVGRLRPKPLRQSRFVLDTHLGQLASYLRLLGFDSLYENSFEDERLAQISSRDSRILLTRDRGLLMRNLVTHGYCVRSSDPEEQLLEVIRRFDLRQQIDPFHRCLRCNGLLKPVEKEAIEDRLLPDTRRYYDNFHICQDCEQVYWKGSHYRRMRRFLTRILALSLESSGESGPRTT